MSGKFEIYRDKADEFRFRLKAGGNWEIILVSEGYTQKHNCENGIDSVQKNAADDDNYERKMSQNNKYYFNLRAGNSEIIGTSEMYETKAARDAGIESVKRNAPDATIEDLT